VNYKFKLWILKHSFVILILKQFHYTELEVKERFFMHKEAIRYLENAKEILRKAKIEDNRYKDIKPVREAFGTAYLAILEAINESLIAKGVSKKDLPEKVEEYEKAIKKHLAPHNGRLLKEFTMLYDALHIAGYYRGLIYNVDMVKDALKAAKSFINKIK